MSANEEFIQGQPQPTQAQSDQINVGQQVPPVSDSSQDFAQQSATYFVNPATGQMYYGVAPQQSQTFNPVQPPNPVQYVLYPTSQVAFESSASQQGNPSIQQSAQEPTQADAQAQSQQSQKAQPDYAKLIKSVEDFAQGDATVSDVLQNLYTQTAQDDQFWKGAIVGAAAAVLLNSDSVRQAMGKTVGGLFAGGAAAKANAENPEQ